MGLSSTPNAGWSVSLNFFLSVLAPWVVSAHLTALKTMGAYDFQFFFPSCVFSLDLSNHRHSITVLKVHQPSKMKHVPPKLLTFFLNLVPNSLMSFLISRWKTKGLPFTLFSYKLPPIHQQNLSALVSNHIQIFTTSLSTVQYLGETILSSSDLPELTLQASLLPLLKISTMLSIYIKCSQMILNEAATLWSALC